MQDCAVSIIWDEEARVWIAESEQVRGLILESPSLDTLIDRVKKTIPELLALEGTLARGVGIRVKAERLLRAA